MKKQGIIFGLTFFVVIIITGTAAAEDGTWVIENVDNTSQSTKTSLAFDLDGNPHISCIDITNGFIKYASFVPTLITVDSRSDNNVEVNVANGMNIKTIGMQTTGSPVVWMIFPVIVMFAGLVILRRN